MFDYPNKLDIIFDKLYLFDIKPIIVGGYIRDYILHIDSKDIDIELYGLDSLDTLENILKEFGDINTVGKSFGVCKLHFENLEIDFSLPREDSKVGQGHKGFSVITNKDLDFTTAASRRDFTINAMGYDVINKLLLDPFNGQKDIQNKILRAVDMKKFSEDPLRVLRGIQFSSRFNFTLDSKLFSLFNSLIKTDALQELPKERVYEEFKKMFLKSANPSLGLHLLHKLNLMEYFGFNQSYKQVEYFAQHKSSDKEVNILIFLSLLYRQDSIHNTLKLTNKQRLLTDIALFLELTRSFDITDSSEYALYTLATKVNIESFLLYLDAYYVGTKHNTINLLKDKATKLDILNKKLPALIQGKELINAGLAPSKEFSSILSRLYEAQKKGFFGTKEEALKYLRTYLVSHKLLGEDF